MVCLRSLHVSKWSPREEGFPYPRTILGYVSLNDSARIESSAPWRSSEMDITDNIMTSQTLGLMLSNISIMTEGWGGGGNMLHLHYMGI